MDTQKCGRCGKKKKFSEFGQKNTGEYNITCKECIIEKYKSSRCPRGREKSQCVECLGGSICVHQIRRTHCVVCGGGGLCPHGKINASCKECDGSSYCEHDRLRYICKECHGSAICPHGRVRYICKDCHGCNICPHEKQRKQCQICDPIGYIKAIVTGRIKKALLRDKNSHTLEYLGCNIETFKKHLESQFVEGMSWDNYGEQEGEWEIDHIIPIKWDRPTLEEVTHRLHYINTQPLWGPENRSKNNNLRPEDETKILRIWHQLTPELKAQWIARKGEPQPKIKLTLKIPKNQ